MFSKKLVLLIAAALMVGCSEVAFTPDDPNVGGDNGGEFTLNEKFRIDQGMSGNAVDILFIVDNSYSMITEQERLGERFNRFISELRSVNWQIGITTTDVSSGSFGVQGSLLTFAGTNSTILRPNQANYEQAFRETIVRRETLNCDLNGGTCPSGDEQAMRAAILAMDKEKGANAGFFRAGADLAVVVISDEDELSNAPVGATHPNEVIQHAKNIFGSQKKITGYGIIIKPGDQACFDAQYSSGGNYGTYVSLFASLTSGVTGSICDVDYSSTLSTIGRHVRDLILSIELSQDPDPSTVKVTFTPAVAGLKWSVDGRKVRFSVAPPDGTSVDVSYRLHKSSTEETSTLVVGQ